MDKNDIKVIFTYETTITSTFICKPNTILKEIFIQFCAENGINLETSFFILSGSRLCKSDFKKKIGDFNKSINGGILNIIGYEVALSEEGNKNSNKKVNIIFKYNSNTYNIEFSIKDKMSTICKYRL